MPTYRYQARQASGVPVYGTQEADSESDLRKMLAARGLELQQGSELAMHAAMQDKPRELPRFYQLRVGERLREVWMTGLPAHDAVHAMAAEPFEHPLLQFMPWLMFLTVCLFVPTLGWSLFISGNWESSAVMALLTLVVVPLAWLLMYVQLDRIPRKVLHRLADQIATGNEPTISRAAGMPVEIRAVMNASVEDEKKALAASDLIPTLAGSRFHQHRFLMALLGSLSLIVVYCVGVYWVMWRIVPMFKGIFEDFDTQLPALTASILWVSRMFEAGGAIGFATTSIVSAALLVLIYIGLSRGRLAEFCSYAPILGVPFRWLMQARVARVLASMLRHRCDRSESLRAATSCSAFRSVQREGEILADSLRRGAPVFGAGRSLSGLPLSLLVTRQSTTNVAPWIPSDSEATTDSDSASLAQNFNTMAQMLEQACQGHGMLLGVLLQSATILIASFSVGLLIISMFLPLIKLLNDLA